MSTYRYGSFVDNQGELARLERQAGAALGLETAMLRTMGLVPGSRVLDVGCGPGIVSRALAEVVRGAPGGRVLGVDVDPDIVAYAAGRAEDSGAEDLEFEVHDILAGPPAGGRRFDFAYCRFLLQHMTDHARVVANVAGSIVTGGVVCAVDVDDAWLSVWPCPPPIERLFALATERQGAFGGDRLVGRKLRSVFHAAGLVDIRAGVVPITDAEVGVEFVLDLVTGFKAQLLASRGVDIDPEAVRRAIAELAMRPDVWAAVGLFYATGRVQ